jgi:predicted metal-dependent hydrolase
VSAQSKPRQLAFLFDSAATPISSRHEIVLGGAVVTYVVRRSARRRGVTIAIDEDGLRVGAASRTSQRRIETLLLKHERWIARKLAQWQERRAPPVAWRSGARVMVLGAEVALKCDSAATVIARTADALLLPFGPEVVGDALRTQVIAWLRESALVCFEQRTAYYAPTLRVAIPSIGLSNAKTRWGTCHPDGRVRLNWRLIQMPLPLIDYVVVHELAHLRQPNHSPRFWREVERVLPDYAERRRALRRTGHQYLIA